MKCRRCGSRMTIEPDVPSVEVGRCVCCGWRITVESWVADVEDEEETNPKGCQDMGTDCPVFELM